MYRKILAYLSLLLAMVIIAGCNVTRDLPEGEYLVSKVKFVEDKSVPRDERITEDRDGLETYVRTSTSTSGYTKRPTPRRITGGIT